VFANCNLWGWAFYGYAVACCIHLPFLKTTNKLAALNNRHTCTDNSGAYAIIPEGVAEGPDFGDDG